MPRVRGQLAVPPAARWGFKVAVSSQGPYALLFLDCIFLPTVRAHFLPVNQKVLLAVLLIGSGPLDSRVADILIGVAFIFILMSAPSCFPSEWLK
jgi:hypothetical protein